MKKKLEKLRLELHSEKKLRKQNASFIPLLVYMLELENLIQEKGGSFLFVFF